MKKTVAFIFVLMLCSSGFAQFGNWGASKDANPKIKEICAAHQVIAIIPFGTNYDQLAIGKNVGKKEKDRIDTKEYSRQCQKNTYDYFIKLKEKKDIDIIVQTPEATNHILDSVGYNYDSLMNMNYSDICALLGVDAVIRGYVDVDKYMSKGGTVAMNMFVGGAPANEQIDVTLSILDRKTGEQVWYFANTLEGDLFSKPERLVNSLLVMIGKKLPYFKKS